MVEHDVAAQAHGLGLGAVPLLAGLEDVAHPVHGHPRLAHVGQHPAQRPHRPGQRGVVGDKGQEVAQGQPALHRRHRSGHHHRHHLKAGEKGPGGPVNAEHLAQLHPEGGKPVVFLPEAVDLKPLPAKGPHHPHTGEILLGTGGQLPLRLIGGLEPGGDLAVKHPGGRAGNGDERQRNQGQLPVHLQHDDGVKRDEKHCAHHLHQLVADEGADDLHVGGAPLDDVAGGVGGVPFKAQALDVAVQAVPQALHKALGALGQVDAHAVNTHAPHRRGQHHRPRRQPQKGQGIGPEPVQGRQRAQKARQIRGFAPQHRVHGEADDLGHQRVAGGVHPGQRNGPGEKAPAAPQMAHNHAGLLPPGQFCL